MSRGAANALVVFLFFGLLGITITIWPHIFFGSIIVKVLMVAIFSILGVFVILDLLKWYEDNPDQVNYRKEKYYGPLSFLYTNNGDEKVKIVSFGKIIGFFVFFLFTVFIIELSYSVVRDCVAIYNTSKVLHNDYQQKQEERVVFYDNLWKTYQEKEGIAEINEEAFHEITQIIMENRKDGENTAWKWTQENQQISYEEFTKFYMDLTSFVERERKGYVEIEKQCQIIARRNNTLLDTFPNNVYNRIFIKCDRINFEPGFTSNYTDLVFETKCEDIVKK